MPRSMWKGSIGFGLVNIPVELYPAEEVSELSFTQLDKRDFSPIGYQRINKTTGEVVDWSNIVKGYEQAEGEYVVLSPADLEEANPKATHTIDIEEFVDLSEIHPMYFDRPYYLAPGKMAGKPYALLRETLKRTGKAGIARIVIRTRQHLAALTTLGDALMLVTLRFAHELRELKLDVPEGGKKKLGLSDREIAMAEQLVGGMVEHWKPEQFKDEYRDDVMKIIHERAEAGAVNVVPAKRAMKGPAERAPTEDLLELLKKSLGSKKAANNDVTAPARSKPPQRHKPEHHKTARRRHA